MMIGAVNALRRSMTKEGPKDAFSKAIMHIIRKEYYKEKSISDELRDLLEQCICEWDELQQLRQVFSTKSEADRVISQISSCVCSRESSENAIEVRSFQKGSPIFFYGDKDDTIFYILKGSVQLFIPKTSEEIRSEMELNRILRQQAEVVLSVDAAGSPSEKQGKNQSQQQQQQLLQQEQQANQWIANKDKFEIVVNAVQKMKGVHIDLITHNTRLRKKYYDEVNGVSRIKKVATMKVRQSFGALSMLLEKPRACTAVAAEESYCVIVSAKNYRKSLGEHFAFINSKYIFLNNSLKVNIRKETLFHLGLLFDSEFTLNLSEYLFKEGESTNFVYLLKKGKVEFQKRLLSRAVKKKSELLIQMANKDDQSQSINEQERDSFNLTSSQTELNEIDSQKFKEASLGLITQGEFFGFEDILICASHSNNSNRRSDVSSYSVKHHKKSNSSHNSQGESLSNSINSSHRNWFVQKITMNRRSYSAKVISSEAIVYRMERAVFVRILQSNQFLDQDLKTRALIKMQYHQHRVNVLQNFEIETGNHWAKPKQTLKEMLTKKLVDASKVSTTITTTATTQKQVNTAVDTPTSKSQAGGIECSNNLLGPGGIQTPRGAQTNKQQQQQQQQPADFTIEFAPTAENGIPGDLYDIPKDISKGNVQFLRFNEGQFSDLKTMKESFVQQGERYKSIRKAKLPTNTMSDENQKIIERIFSSKNSPAAKHFKESFLFQKLQKDQQLQAQQQQELTLTKSVCVSPPKQPKIASASSVFKPKSISIMHSMKSNLVFPKDAKSLNVSDIGDQNTETNIISSPISLNGIIPLHQEEINGSPLRNQSETLVEFYSPILRTGSKRDHGMHVNSFRQKEYSSVQQQYNQKDNPNTLQEIHDILATPKTNTKPNIQLLKSEDSFLPRKSIQKRVISSCAPSLVQFEDNFHDDDDRIVEGNKGNEGENAFETNAQNIVNKVGSLNSIQATSHNRYKSLIVSTKSSRSKSSGFISTHTDYSPESYMLGKHKQAKRVSLISGSIYYNSVFNSTQQQWQQQQQMQRVLLDTRKYYNQEEQPQTIMRQTWHRMSSPTLSNFFEEQSPGKKSQNGSIVSLPSPKMQQLQYSKNLSMPMQSIVLLSSQDLIPLPPSVVPVQVPTIPNLTIGYNKLSSHRKVSSSFNNSLVFLSNQSSTANSSSAASSVVVEGQIATQIDFRIPLSCKSTKKPTSYFSKLFESKRKSQPILY